MTTETGKDAGDGGNEVDKDVDVPAVSDETTEVNPETGKSDRDVWAELDAAEGANAAGEEGDDQAATTDDDAGKPDDEVDLVAAKATPDKPAADAADKGKGPDKGAAADKTKPDPWANATPEQLAERDRLAAEVARLDQSDRSNRGRVSALTQKLNGQRGVGTKKPEPPKPFQDERGKTFAKEYPEVAAPVAAEIAAVRTELDELKAERVKREEAETHSRLTKNEQVLEAKHPKFDETAATKQFGDWVLTQPNYVQAAVRRNFEAIVDAAEAVDIFDRYEAFRSSQAGSEPNTQTQGKQGKPGAQDGPAGDSGKNGNGLAGKRQRQLDSASGTRSSGPGLADGIPEEGDAQAIWDAFDRKEAREARQRQRA